MDFTLTANMTVTAVQYNRISTVRYISNHNIQNMPNVVLVHGWWLANINFQKLSPVIFFNDVSCCVPSSLSPFWPLTSEVYIIISRMSCALRLKVRVSQLSAQQWTVAVYTWTWRASYSKDVAGVWWEVTMIRIRNPKSHEHFTIYYIPIPKSLRKSVP